MFKKLIRKFKRYDLDEMKDLQDVSRNIGKNIQSYKKAKDNGNLFGQYGLAYAIANGLVYIEEYYPLEAYVAIYSAFEDDLKEIHKFLDK